MIIIYMPSANPVVSEDTRTNHVVERVTLKVIRQLREKEANAQI
jgi:hypothetical protein